VSSTASRKQNAAQKSYITDDYVWAAICDLDSPADAPQDLQRGYKPKRGLQDDEPLILLDDLPHRSAFSSFAKFLIVLAFLLTLIVLIGRG
jgi:hypothetical protein